VRCALWAGLAGSGHYWAYIRSDAAAAGKPAYADARISVIEVTSLDMQQQQQAAARMRTLLHRYSSSQLYL
jgi:hypothetical protein